MVFLKSVKLCGFKSFSDGLEIKFQTGLTGIVGPNGSGKSNISDAFRWALGESSLKSLRSKHSADVIFEGSKKRNAAEMAEVILRFDNQKHYLSHDQTTIEIKRRLFRSDSNSYYAINGDQVRLRDIRNLAMDAGVSKGSLAIIGQSQVFRFAEMNSEDRRLFFDEAAGISKYKQRKKETISQLSRTEVNLRRAQDLLSEHTVRIPKLKKQSETAEKYLKIKTKLESIEVQTLINDIARAQDQLIQLQNRQQELVTQQAAIDATMVKSEASFNLLSHANNELDQEMSQNLIRYESCLSTMATIMSQTDDTKLTGPSVATPAIRQALEIKFQSNQTQLEQTKTQLEQTKTQLEELRFRLQTIQAQRETTQQKLQVNDLQTKDFQVRLQRQQANDQAQGIKSRAVSSIIQHFQESDGVRGIVRNCFSFEPKYEALFLVALGRRQENIIVEDTHVARRLIGFLKSNQLGTATFLPVSSIKPRTLSAATLTIAQSVPGFMGVGTSFIHSQPGLENIHRYLLGSLLVTSDLTSAEQLSKTTDRRFAVATLNGDLIHPFGSIFGGSLKSKTQQQLSVADLQTKLTQLKTDRTEQLTTLSQLETTIQQLSTKVEMSQRQVGYGQALVANLELTAQELQKSYRHQFQTELQTATSKPSPILTKATDVTKLKTTIQKLKLVIENQRTTKKKQTEQILKLEVKLKNHRNLQQKTAQESNQVTLEIDRITLQINNWQNILLRDYEMTFATAQSQFATTKISITNETRNQIKQLRWQLKQIGSFNPDAIQEYKTLKAKTDQLKTDYEQIGSSLKKLVQLIEELDQKMETTSREFIAQVNTQLKSTFQHLLGSGFAQINFENPDEIISSGITIAVQPPGKRVKNINLLSGGEKTLVALAVLFAILKVRPLPLVFLDEVEASLDPANASRVGRYLHTFTEHTQFIIITHRLETMEHCDQLYGTTMEEKGVTKLIGVELQQAKTMFKSK